MSELPLDWLVGATGVALAGFVKGTIGFGFPAIATPILALVADVRVAVVLLLVPNLLMDGVQVLRRPGLWPAARRHAALIGFGVVGMVAGTQFLARVSPRVLLGTLGAVILGVVLLALARPAWRLPPRLERRVAPLVGLAVGLLGGLTNVFGPPLAPYFTAIGLSKTEFVRAMAMTFLTLKAAQGVAVWQVGLVDPALARPAVGVAAVGLLGFGIGVWVHERIRPEVFTRAVHGLLVLLSVLMLVRALRG